MKNLLSFIPCFFLLTLLHAQGADDLWMYSQVKKVAWKATYKGVLADFHPVSIILVSDYDQIAGFIIHDGDQKKHRLVGDWNKTEHFQLQEHDDNDRLSGYLVGTVSKDQLDMQWMSADQSRLFEVKAFPESLIKIKTFKPSAEWIEVSSSPKLMVSVQKMEYGIVSGLANRGGQYTRFEGYCLDGTCSIWNTVIQVPKGAPIQMQMRQKDATSYRVMLNGIEYTGNILDVTPLVVKRFDNSVGFLDLVYPDFPSVAFKNWLSAWSDKLWAEGINYLQTQNQQGNPGRLIHRSSGWIEILEDTDAYVSGMITYINPGSTRRAPFVWLKKENVVLNADEFLNLPADAKKLSDMALKVAGPSDDVAFTSWRSGAGYQAVVPSAAGIIASTEFNMIYGDDLQLIPATGCKDTIKRKYWKYFGW